MQILLDFSVKETDDSRRISIVNFISTIAVQITVKICISDWIKKLIAYI